MGAVAALSQVVTVAGPGVVGLPSINGDPRPRAELHCASGVWDGSYDLTFQWLRDGAPVGGVTSVLRVLDAADVGHAGRLRGACRRARLRPCRPP